MDPRSKDAGYRTLGAMESVREARVRVEPEARDQRVNEKIEATLRAPHERDAAALRHLIGEVGTLDRNSCYTYLLLCTHFATTCLVAERREQLVGFVLAYRPPSDLESLFVWQIGVARHARGEGLARRMLRALLERPGCRDARFLTATVAPENASSRALFHGFARARGALCEESRGFSASLFDSAHSDEKLLRVGPLKGKA